MSEIAGKWPNKTSDQEFEDQFKVNSEDYKDEDYTQIIKDACLCQLDLEKFFSDRKNFESDGVNWFSSI